MTRCSRPPLSSKVCRARHDPQLRPGRSIVCPQKRRSVVPCVRAALRQQAHPERRLGAAAGCPQSSSRGRPLRSSPSSR